MDSWFEKFQKITQEIVEKEGCILYDLEFTGTGAGRTLRLFIDKESGVGIDDCSNVSKALNLVLDSNDDLIPGEAYNLEVSTPGLDRVLKVKWHFEKVVGKKIYIKLTQSLGALGALGVEEKGMLSMKQFEDILQSVEADLLVFSLRGHLVKVPLASVEKAKLVFDFKTNLKKK